MHFTLYATQQFRDDAVITPHSRQVVSTLGHRFLRIVPQGEEVRQGDLSDLRRTDSNKRVVCLLIT